MEKVYLFIVALAFVAITTVWRGFVLLTLWAWFIASAFGLPAMSITMAIGLCLAMTLLTHQVHQHTNTSGSEIDRLVAVFAKSLSFTAFILLVGYVTQLFM